MESHKESLEEILVFCDDQQKTWLTILHVLQQLNLSFVKLPSTTPIRRSWRRFQSASLIIIHWECFHRGGGTIVEEILETCSDFDTSRRIIVVTDEPSREDVIYFSELGLQKIVRLAHNTIQTNQAIKELARLLKNPSESNITSTQWRKLQKKIDQLKNDASEEELKRLHRELEDIADDKTKISAKYFDLIACLSFKNNKYEMAESYWEKTLELNPHYARAYRGLIDLHCHRKDYRRALNLIQKLQSQNKKNISRLVKMGEIYCLMADDLKAEHYFNLALERDPESSGALNGLAFVRFRQERLDESRDLLEKSTAAYKLAAMLNQIGIALVKQSRFEEALNHYSKAQYVLPQQEKGPMLFYNIGLCYSRWERYEMAKDFLRLALVKEPGYDKAQKLLHQLELKSNAA